MIAEKDLHGVLIMHVGWLRN
ncbi:hypothetical protein BREVUG8_10060 [Brevundimonas sp. G8]|nr:hypothetical protein BREVUG8_10060 [Brevundimonas sp. G8]